MSRLDAEPAMREIPHDERIRIVSTCAPRLEQRPCHTDAAAALPRARLVVLAARPAGAAPLCTSWLISMGQKKTRPPSTGPAVGRSLPHERLSARGARPMARGAIRSRPDRRRVWLFDGRSSSACRSRRRSWTRVDPRGKRRRALRAPGLPIAWGDHGNGIARILRERFRCGRDAGFALSHVMNPDGEVVPPVNTPFRSRLDGRQTSGAVAVPRSGCARRPAPARAEEQILLAARNSKRASAFWLRPAPRWPSTRAPPRPWRANSACRFETAACVRAASPSYARLWSSIGRSLALRCVRTRDIR